MTTPVDEKENLTKQAEVSSGYLLVKGRVKLWLNYSSLVVMTHMCLKEETQQFGQDFLMFTQNMRGLRKQIKRIKRFRDVNCFYRHVLTTSPLGEPRIPTSLSPLSVTTDENGERGDTTTPTLPPPPCLTLHRHTVVDMNLVASCSVKTLGGVDCT